MTRDEQIPPGEAEAYAGLGQILSEVIYITTFNWGVFLTEAELHIQVLVSAFQINTMHTDVYGCVCVCKLY